MLQYPQRKVHNSHFQLHCHISLPVISVFPLFVNDIIGLNTSPDSLLYKNLYSFRLALKAPYGTLPFLKNKYK